jgi:hypothetical protein
MAYTIQQSINFAQTFIQYSPLAVGTGNEPALSLANEIQNTILNPPFTWPWNRNESSALTLAATTQDYTVNLTDFGFLEKVSLTDPDTNEVWEIKDVYNNLARGKADANTRKLMRPNACCVISVSYGTSVKLRFMGVPNKAYGVLLTYQKLVTPLTTLTGGTGTWALPDQLIDVFNNLFVGEAMAVVDDARANLYRQRGIGVLLGKAEGLTEMEINAFLEQYWQRDHQNQYRTMRTQQGAQGGAV